MRPMRLMAAFLAALIFVVLPAGAAAAQPPSNDAFADAVPVPDIPFEDVVDVGDATTEPGEPIETCAPFANTVWYDLTLDASTDVVVDTSGSNYDTAVAVWTGDSLSGLDNVTCVDDTFDSLQAVAPFSAEAGVTYRIQIGAFGEAFEGATLQLLIDKAPRSTGRPDISKFNARGVTARAFLEDFDEETGTFSFTEVNAFQFREKVFQQRPYQSSILFVSQFEERFDPETGKFSFVEIFGSTELSPDQFDVDRQLRSGFVTADVTLTGLSCTEGADEPNGDGFQFQTVCTEIGPELASVDVNWQGEGPTFKSRFTDRFSTNGVRFSSRSSSTSRDAEVSGGVQGDTIVFDLDGAFGTLSRDSFAEMILLRGDTLFL